MKTKVAIFAAVLLSFFCLTACSPLQTDPTETHSEPVPAATLNSTDSAATQQISELQTAVAAPLTPAPTRSAGLDSSDFVNSVIWIRQFGTSLTDEFGGILSDRSGYVYLTCLCSLGSPQPFDSPLTPSGGQVVGRAPTLLKFDGEGHLVWQVAPDLGLFSMDSPIAAADNAGNLITEITGLAENSNKDISFITKYDYEGKQIWMNTVPDYYISDIATDTEGDIYIVGRAVIAPETRANAYLRKYDSSGAELWEQNLDGAINGLTLKIVIGLDGNSYVVGSTSEALPGLESVGGYDVFIQSYTPAGTENWTRQFGTTADDFIEDSIIDTSGSIYVAYHNGDPLLEKYDLAGSQLWIKKLDRPGSEWVKLAADQENNLYVLLNHNWPSNPADAEVIKFDSSANMVWTRVFPDAWTAGPELIVTGWDGSLFLGGWTVGALPGQNDSGNYDVFLLMISE